MTDFKNEGINVLSNEGASVAVRRLFDEEKVYRVYNLISRKPRQGYGTALMQEVCKIADEMEVELYLKVRPYHYKGSAAISVTDLYEFYARLGFVFVSWGFGNPMMIRKPRRSNEQGSTETSSDQSDLGIN